MTDQTKCQLCAQNSGEVPSHGDILWQNETWILRHFMKGRGVPGLADADDPASCRELPAIR